MLKAKLTGRRLAGAGAAIQGRMLQIALREQLPIWTESALAQFVQTASASPASRCSAAAGWCACRRARAC